MGMSDFILFQVPPVVNYTDAQVWPSFDAGDSDILTQQ
ncbi:unnamed protein product (macronuclear) [Paramecium tetraurelia]|uniref:Uncharacterized protein n=1 Tax=Paramecium tetraurelia TaxID=5888 RepID=A0CTI0_PARTE|nr:uncharacterized protein GSPATT00010331001 [Paramecium tetraurelia]CAK74097.1 unnamed protein product [Paramecium tetraurelia]|eukprot:XP_001441494.1 hypothetical protein (macronuclear) [Paramecium tetraurelia strain d4-2]